MSNYIDMNTPSVELYILSVIDQSHNWISTINRSQTTVA